MARYTNADLEKWNGIKNALSDGRVINKVFFDQFIQPLTLFAVTDTEVMVTSEAGQILPTLLNRFGRRWTARSGRASAWGIR